ncbi:hypothetical protein MP228_004227 [Amoeboaphelidium protococcarum]|nr:hypothetical protein MP228_004227 [Amoeboaphelidium protococcarum]
MVANTRHAVLLHLQWSHSSCWSKYCIPSLTGWRAVLKIPKLVLPPHSHRCRSLDQASLAGPCHYLHVAPQSSLIGVAARVLLFSLSITLLSQPLVPQFRFIGIFGWFSIIVCMWRRSLFLLALLARVILLSSSPLVPQYRFIGIFGWSSSSFACSAAVYSYWRYCKSHPPLPIATGTVVYIHRYLWLALYHWLHVAPQSTVIGVTARALLCFRSSYHLYYSHSFIGSTVESLDIRLQISPFEFVKASLSALQSTVKSWQDLLGKSLYYYYYIEMHCCCGSPHNRVCQKFCVGMACLQIL